MADADIGHGIVLQRGDGGSPTETFTTICEVREPGLPMLARDSVERTHTASTDRYKEFIPGERDGGEVSMTAVYDPGDSGITALYGDFNDDTIHNYKAVKSGEWEWAFSGFLTGMEPSTPRADLSEITLTFKVTGKPVLTVS